MREYSVYQQTESLKQFMKSKYSGGITTCNIHWKTLFDASNQILYFKVEQNWWWWRKMLCLVGTWGGHEGHSEQT